MFRIYFYDKSAELQSIDANMYTIYTYEGHEELILEVPDVKPYLQFFDSFRVILFKHKELHIPMVSVESIINIEFYE